MRQTRDIKESPPSITKNRELKLILIKLRIESLNTIKQYIVSLVRLAPHLTKKK